MAYKKQLRDKDGNVVYPDVGLNLDDVVYSDDPTEEFDSVIDPNSYSTSEKWTGGYWIDGKKIYKKTINFGSLPNSGEKQVNHGISLGNVIKIEGWCFSNALGWYNLPFAASGNWAIEVKIYYNTVVVVTGVDRSGISTAYITLYYTKSS